MKLCECGCGTETRFGYTHHGVMRRFVRGHNFRQCLKCIQTRFKIGHITSHSEETKKRISEANKGFHFSPSTEFRKGHTAWGGNKGKKFPVEKYPNFGMRGKHHSEEMKKKMSLAKKGKRWSEKTKKKHQLLWQNPEHRKKMSEVAKQTWQNPEHRKKMSEIHKKLGQNPKYKERVSKTIEQLWQTPGYREKQSKIHKKLWQDPIYRDETIRSQKQGLHLRPNKPEQKLIDLIRQHDLPFDYVGDGKIVIEGFCPDFIDNDGSKRIIELFGGYWHRLPRIVERDKKRLKAYEKYGFKTLVIWEHELAEPNKVLDKINRTMKTIEKIKN